jgi:predicted RNase H-like HicB family nuclease
MSMPAYANERAKTLRMKVTVIVESDGDAFHAYCPAFKGLHVAGGSVDEALQFAKEAAIVYVTSLAMHNESLPVGPDCNVFEEEQIPHIPAGALLHHLELLWPYQNTSGIS